MRNAISDEITKLAFDDDRIVLLIGDVGWKIFDNFKNTYPNRFFNCGIAEANMITVAAGLAMNGFRPFVYTFATFNIERPYEQIRIDIAYQNLPVVIIGLGGGLSYSSLGISHSTIEDIALTRLLPNFTVICPADTVETRAAIQESIKKDSPVYIRIGKEKETIIHKSKPNFQIGTGISLKSGKDICIIACGPILSNIIEASEILLALGIETQIVSFHTIKPIDYDLLKKIFSKYSLIFTIEEHSLIGGLGSAIAEWVVDQPERYKAQLVRIGIPEQYLNITLDRENSLDFFGLSPLKLVDKILSHYQTQLG